MQDGSESTYLQLLGHVIASFSCSYLCKELAIAS